MITNNQIIEVNQEFEDLMDYKFFCFNGKVKFYKVDFGRFKEHHANYYSIEGKLLNFGEAAIAPMPTIDIVQPSNINKMISLAELLSAKEKFLRVDFYNVNGKIYFGELTFYPASGMMPWTAPEVDKQLGLLLNI